MDDLLRKLAAKNKSVRLCAKLTILCRGRPGVTPILIDIMFLIIDRPFQTGNRLLWSFMQTGVRYVVN